MDIPAIAAMAPVIPVLTIGRVADAVPLARALVKGGLPVREITLRTRTAMAALEAAQVEQIQRLGARFAVSPGCTPSVVAATRAGGLPFLPGVQTVLEAMVLAEQGYQVLKFFPAEPAGGLACRRRCAAPDRPEPFRRRSRRSDRSVGGSWVAPAAAVDAKDWSQIERLAAAASKYKRS